MHAHFKKAISIKSTQNYLSLSNRTKLFARVQFEKKSLSKTGNLIWTTRYSSSESSEVITLGNQTTIIKVTIPYLTTL
jgi:hypothetical protein